MVSRRSRAPNTITGIDTTYAGGGGGGSEPGNPGSGGAGGGGAGKDLQECWNS